MKEGWVYSSTDNRYLPPSSAYARYINAHVKSVQALPAVLRKAIIDEVDMGLGFNAIIM